MNKTNFKIQESKAPLEMEQEAWVRRKSIINLVITVRSQQKLRELRTSATWRKVDTAESAPNSIIIN